MSYPDLVKNSKIETAERKRKCAHNKSHDILQSDKCLVISQSILKYTRKKSYCLSCAQLIIERALENVNTLKDQARG